MASARPYHDHILPKNKISSLTRNYVYNDSSASLKEFLGKLTDNARFPHSNSSGGLVYLGSGKRVTLNAQMLVALENLLKITVDNSWRKMYDRFLFNHKLSSSLSYTWSKHHTNHNVLIYHPTSKHVRILGLLSIKPLCHCASEVSKYCCCTIHNILFIKVKHASHRTLFRDADFNGSFIVEAEESEELIAIYPSDIESKCVSVSLNDKTYFCPLPYRIYDDKCEYLYFNLL